MNKLHQRNKNKSNNDNKNEYIEGTEENPSKKDLQDLKFYKKISFFISFILSIYFIFKIYNKYTLNNNEKIWNKNELQGKRGQLLLGIAGRVYDVTSGVKNYGKNGNYNVFIGKDASLAFGTANFADEYLIDDISSLIPSQCLALQTWVDFYEDKEEYYYLGKINGFFYDENGQYTKNYYKFQKCLNEGKKEKEDDKIHPRCDQSWVKDIGSKKWCDEEQNMVPRLRNRGNDQWGCYCYRKNELYHFPELKILEGCDENASLCHIKD